MSQSPRERSVFINCPFDEAFRPILEAILFSVVCCGFIPRSANESGTIADSRMERIVKAIEGSRYSIHDLSRCRGEGDANLARFNMPLELGIAMAFRFAGRARSGRHDWLALVPLGRAHRQVLSDLAGYDPEECDGSEAAAVGAVTAWLASRPDALQAPPARAVLDALPSYRSRAASLNALWLGRAPWLERIRLAAEIASELRSS